MRARLMVLTLLSLAAVLARAPSAHADARGDRYDPRRLYGGAWLGFGGDATADGDGEFGGDLDTTLGGQFGLDWVTHRFFSLGFEARIGASKWERMRDRTKLVDLDFKPRFRPIVFGPVEVYATLPIGLTVPRPGDVADQEFSGKVGWNVGAGVGVNLFITRRFAFNAEPIWLYHHYKVDDSPANDFALKQFSLLLNGVIAL